MTDSPDVPVRRWILVPASLTLVITLVRLAGELMHWNPVFFSRASGGAGAVVGIVWLVPILGIYFAMKLRDIGERPPGLLRGFGFVVLAGLVPIATGFLGSALGLRPVQILGLVCVALFVSILVVKPAWPSLARLLWFYGLAARIPVILVMLFAILGDWGTHYDVTSPELASLTPLVRWLVIAVLPQITLWMGFTVVCGMVFGLLTIAVAGKKS
jgi:hypothetical protein